MKLTDLEPQFFRYETRNETWDTATGPKTGPREYHIPVDTLADAQCIFFLCPKCFAAQGSNYGVHSIEVTFAGRGVSDNMGSHNKAGNPTRWQIVDATASPDGHPDVKSEDFKTLTLVPSILIEGCCGWHGYVTRGDAS